MFFSSCPGIGFSPKHVAPFISSISQSDRVRELNKKMPSPILIKAAEEEAIQAIAKHLPDALGWATVGIICGSGLGGLAATLHADPRFELPYADIPHFPQSAVKGHAGKFVFGKMGSGAGTPVVMMVGRAQYE